ncbi:putative Csl4p homologue [Leishmania infantum JPCM5]|uniref:Exosome_component_CSL4_-_putative n=3 Tax=Leishmania donovani species complex TaxID=38574 RepID=A0A6L0XE49_LEIIN|nr:putative Csl4p homologue [Leishmania infantum JPCM5]XP_003861074.1 Csl4p homologue, putative [Leishmania donovani]CAC9490316.1 exosome_component_CSL4_-_putative [Leishmania infantum]AYU79065.1 exosome component CSL4, putative [Leishmania donovani]CAM68285.1 putative Csl4p homologue [Leishmania infantum JPCM5]CBZ34372.1 Csl4p homologue, putative [Leishmania donovani]SUZ42062.1 exosome_component_CSL4_-_putative [Leishmania infantum]|eukprot:XP_001465855.1 putative Csl4p homologue [Leishmania infantum JPCM5]
MPVILHTGARVAPGDAIFTSPAAVTTSHDALEGAAAEEADVVPGEGCVVQYVERYVAPSAPTASAPSAVVERSIIATRHGVAQWDGRLVSVFALASCALASAGGTGYATACGAGASVGSAVSSPRHAVLGPRPGDTVHIRITRLNRLFAFGEILAVNWSWCSHRSFFSAAAGGGSNSGVFKGILRQEDIRPFKPTKDQLLPPPLSLAFGVGDVVLAEVISQSDAHQCQLSTTGEGCGVVESFITTVEGQYGGQAKVKLEHIPGRRDAMMIRSTGEVVPRWCPLLL